MENINSTITALLSKTTKSLALYLEKVLPSLFDDWWDEAVVDKLSYYQKQRIEQLQNICNSKDKHLKK